MLAWGRSARWVTTPTLPYVFRKVTFRDGPPTTSSRCVPSRSPRVIVGDLSKRDCPQRFRAAISDIPATVISCIALAYRSIFLVAANFPLSNVAFRRHCRAPSFRVDEPRGDAGSTRVGDCGIRRARFSPRHGGSRGTRFLQLHLAFPVRLN